MSSLFISANDNFLLSDHLWDDYTLVLPCISVGNVPQLAVDLLINSLLPCSDKGKDLELVGYIYSKHVRPFAGPDPFKLNGNMYSTSIQVFASVSNKLVIIQQRSPIYKEFRNEFYGELTKLLAHHRFAQVVLLSSSFDQFLPPESFQSQPEFPIMHLSSKLSISLKSHLEEKLKIKPVPKVNPFTMEANESDGKIHLPGSGSARSFVRYFSANSSDVVCLVMFCSEGDNRWHAFQLADKMVEVLGHRNASLLDSLVSISKSNSTYEDQLGSGYRWSVPFSWRMLFGEEPPAEIF